MESQHPCAVLHQLIAGHQFTERGTLPQLSPLPEIPADLDQRKYTLDRTQRIIFAQFGRTRELSKADEQFLLECFERDDITVIVRGLHSKLTPHLWTWDYVLQRCGDLIWHGFKTFKRDTNGQFVERGWRSMSLRDYDRYLVCRRDALERTESEAERVFVTVRNHDGKQFKIDVLHEVVYLIDFSIPTHLPELEHDLRRHFCLDVLPGGEHCSLRHVSMFSRPQMGPNLYVTPPGGSTCFHQDGHGTVDSGHQCLTGRNEVVMLRRLDETHNQVAMSELCHKLRHGLRDMPHGGTSRKPEWPTEAQLDRLRSFGIHLSHFVLEPGDYVHINKARLHAFRKLAPGETAASESAFEPSKILDHSDDSVASSDAVVSRPRLRVEAGLCVSVAWDWQFEGVSRNGIAAEAKTMLECAEYNRRFHTSSLAIPRSCIIQGARASAAALTSKRKLKEFLSHCDRATASLTIAHSDDKSHMWIPIDEVRARATELSSAHDEIMLSGLKPAIDFTLEMEKEDAHAAPNSSLTENITVDASVPPHMARIDPYGLDGFTCKLCNVELANSYMHCLGCENLLSTDWNICLQCHDRGADAVNAADAFHLSDSHLTQKEHFVPFGAQAGGCGDGTSASRSSGNRCTICHKDSATECGCHLEFERRCRFSKPHHLRGLRRTMSVLQDEEDCEALPVVGESLLPDATKVFTAPGCAPGAGNVDQVVSKNSKHRKRVRSKGASNEPMLDNCSAANAAERWFGSVREDYASGTDLGLNESSSRKRPRRGRRGNSRDVSPSSSLLDAQKRLASYRMVLDAINQYAENLCIGVHQSVRSVNTIHASVSSSRKRGSGAAVTKTSSSNEGIRGKKKGSRPKRNGCKAQEWPSSYPPTENGECISIEHLQQLRLERGLDSPWPPLWYKNIIQLWRSGIKKKCNSGTSLCKSIRESVLTPLAEARDNRCTSGDTVPATADAELLEAVGYAAVEHSMTAAGGYVSNNARSVVMALQMLAELETIREATRLDVIGPLPSVKALDAAAKAVAHALEEKNAQGGNSIWSVDTGVFSAIEAKDAEIDVLIRRILGASPYCNIGDDVVVDVGDTDYADDFAQSESHVTAEIVSVDHASRTITAKLAAGQVLEGIDFSSLQLSGKRKGHCDIMRASAVAFGRNNQFSACFRQLFPEFSF